MSRVLWYNIPNMFDHALEMFEGLDKLPDVTKDDTYSGVYAWYFPECQKDMLIPVYIGQSKNLYNRCHHHHLKLNYLYSLPPVLGEELRPPHHFDTYDNMRVLLNAAGISERPKERFKVLERMEVVSPEELLEREQYYILDYASNVYGFNSAVPFELLYIGDREYLERLWSYLWTSLDSLDENTALGKIQRSRIESYGVKRINNYLEHKNDISQ